MAFTSLGMVRYLSALQYCEMVVGNSSSGIIEAPTFGIPTVNIGNRQLGRVRASSVIDCGNSMEEISGAIRQAQLLKKDERMKDIRNPYEKDGTSESILSEIRNYLLTDTSTVKKFYDISFTMG